jgi:hypothetical protein
VLIPENWSCALTLKPTSKLKVKSIFFIVVIII